MTAPFYRRRRFSNSGSGCRVCDHWETVSARQLLASLERIAGLPAEGRDEAARAYSGLLEANRLAEEKQYADAAELGGPVLETRRRLLGDGDVLTLNAMNDLGAALFLATNPDLAEPLLREALAGRQALLGPDHPRTMLTRVVLANCCRLQSRFEEAGRLYAESLDGRRRVLGDDHLKTLQLVSRQAHLARDQSHLEEAEKLYRQVLAEYRRVLGDKHEETLGALCDLSLILQDMGKFDEAEEAIREAVDTARRDLEPDDPQSLSILNRWSTLLMGRGRYDEAEPVLLELLAGARKLYGEESSFVALVYQNFGGLYYSSGKLGDAEVYFNKALELRRELFGENNARTLTTMINRAHVLVSLGRLSEAEQAYRQGLEGRRALLGDEHLDTLTAMNSLGYCCRSQGRLSDAEYYFRKSLEGFLRIVPEDHPNTLTAYLNLGHILEAQWRLPEAEPLIRRALAGYRAVYGEDHPRTLLGLHNMAHLLEDQGHLEEAEAAYFETLEGRRRVLGPDHPRTITVLNNLGILARKQGQLDVAEERMRLALADRRRVLGDENPHTLTSIENLGVILMRQDRLEEAEPLIREALDGRRRVLGENHPRTLGSMQNLGRLLEEKGELDQAELLILGAQDGLRGIFGEAHVNITGSLNLLGELYYRKGDLAGATAAWTEAAESFEAARLRSGARGLERVHFAAGHSPLAPLAACLARGGKAVEAWQRFEASLARGLLDTVSSRYARPLSREERQRESDLISRLSKLDERMGRIYGMAGPDAGDEQAVVGEKLRAERDGLLQELAIFQSEISGKYGVAAGEVYGLQRIQTRIPAGTALLGWVDVVPTGTAGKKAGEHWACLIRKSGSPVWVALPGSGPGGAWTAADSELIGQLREALGKRARRAADRRRLALLRQRLRAQRIEPLVPHLAGISNLVVLPAGQMAGVPVEALANDYTVSYTPSGTMFAWLGEKRDQGAGRGPADRPPLLALGDPVFTSASVTDAKAPESGDPAVRALPAPGPSRQVRIGSLMPLPGTRREVEAIARLFDPPEGMPGPLVLLGSAASEQRLDALSVSGQLEGFRYIHLATHGVMDDQVAMRSALILSQDRLGDSLQRVIEGKDVFDGWLTGEQIVRTWKLDADLVTLSGCETALGQEAGGEGYLGFSQALFVAGARSLVLSLWKVDDRATMLLMQRFYENLLGRFSSVRGLPGAEFEPGVAMPRAEALREAKAWLSGLTADEVRELDPAGNRSGTRDAGSGPSEPVNRLSGKPFEDPRYWAAFILLGDPL